MFNLVLSSSLVLFCFYFGDYLCFGLVLFWFWFWFVLEFFLFCFLLWFWCWFWFSVMFLVLFFILMVFYSLYTCGFMLALMLYSLCVAFWRLSSHNQDIVEFWCWVEEAICTSFLKFFKNSKRFVFLWGLVFFLWRLWSHVVRLMSYMQIDFAWWDV